MIFPTGSLLGVLRVPLGLSLQVNGCPTREGMTRTLDPSGLVLGGVAPSCPPECRERGRQPRPELLTDQLFGFPFLPALPGTFVSFD